MSDGNPNQPSNDNKSQNQGNAPAPAPSAAPKPTESKSKERYFKSHLAGLAFRDGEDEVARFVPHYETYQGDRIKVGYLAVTDAKVAKRVDEDPNTEEISKKDYEKAVKQQQAGY